MKKLAQYKGLRKVLETFLNFNWYPEEMKVIRSLYGGDWELTKDNILTKVHTYQRESKFITYTAMNHRGSKRYFNEVKNILDNCDCVLHEKHWQSVETKINELLEEIVDEGRSSSKILIDKHPKLKERADKIKCYSEKYSRIFLLNPQKALSFARKFDPWEIIEDQRKCINVNKPNWELCDIISYEELQKIQQKIDENMAKINKIKLIDAMLAMLENQVLAEKNQLTYLCYVNLFKGGWGDIISMPDVWESLADRANNILEEKLKNKLNNENIKTIGIIYGAGHGPAIRRTIESLGFKEIKTLMLKVF